MIYRTLALLTLQLPLIANAQFIVNGDFAAPPILGPGQTPVEPAQSKAIGINPLYPEWYAAAISGIPNWINSFTDGGRDAGLRRIDFDGSGDTQYAFINNWDTRLSQVSPLIIAPGQTYQAEILVGFDGPAKAGRFQLWAGAPDATNPDVFPVSAVLLAGVSVASTGWTNYIPDLELSIGDWHLLELTYTAPVSGPMIGQPLTVSFLTSLYSVGPTFWDDAALTVVPEPASWLMALVALFALTAERRTQYRIISRATN